ncbi:hypothetical protein FRB96_002709 [Tulasnella sp. 330]|nr:hypothetical protein FRB96_002709 [Tulasnella sp. 330]KAG8884373.1 hypothetical protein FRB97_004382 [Tulasnella sp. 331]KAG8888042.1 hypothetical protein FRB98_008506 [Tulasnella sp. 332]
MPKVILDGAVLAESNDTIVVENNHYFPPSSLTRSEDFVPSNTSSTCPWKGKAAYYNLKRDGKTVSDIAWYYPAPKDAAKNIKNYVAFYKNKVTIQD